jgi:hypothetical protein
MIGMWSCFKIVFSKFFFTFAYKNKKNNVVTDIDCHVEFTGLPMSPCQVSGGGTISGPAIMGDGYR